MLNYKLAGEIYGVFSKVCFMIDSGRYNVPDEVVNAYEVASRALEVSNEVKQDELQVLLDFITDNTNSNYWIDFDEPLFIDEDDDCSCDECTCLDDDCECLDLDDEELDIDPDEVKYWAKQIGEALDKIAQESLNKSDKPIKIEITVKED